jgi:hypothetical protein
MISEFNNFSGPDTLTGQPLTDTRADHDPRESELSGPEFLRAATIPAGGRNAVALAGETGSGSSAPGQLRASPSLDGPNAVGTSDAAGEAAQAERSPATDGAGVVRRQIRRRR